MHPLQGKWQITAHSPLGDMPMVAEMFVDEGEKTFTGTVTDNKTSRSYPINNGLLDGNNISYSITMKFGLISMTFALRGEFNEADNTCKGVAKAMRMEGAYEGFKIVE